MIVAPYFACYLCYSQHLLPQNKMVVKKIIHVGTLLTEQALKNRMYIMSVYDEQNYESS